MAVKFDRIYIEVSNICNFGCPFCSSVNRQPRSMSIEEFSSILNQVKAYTNEICLHVLGEPLIYPHLQEVLALCQNAEIKINLVTNGYYITEKLAILMQYSTIFKKISFSVHSYIYHKINMADRLNNIITSAVTLSSLGVSIELRNLLGNNDAEFNNTFTQAIVNCANVQLIDTSRNQKIDDKLYYVVKKPFSWPDMSKDSVNRPHSKGKMYCLGGKTHIAILSNLNVVPCCLDSGGEITLGNLKDMSLEQILNSAQFNNLCQSFTNGKPAHALCTTCKYNQK